MTSWSSTSLGLGYVAEQCSKLLLVDDCRGLHYPINIYNYIYIYIRVYRDYYHQFSINSEKTREMEQHKFRALLNFFVNPLCSTETVVFFDVTEEDHHFMTEDVFIRTIRNRFFLRGIRRVVQLPSAQSWKPPKGYSFDVDTARNHYCDTEKALGTFCLAQDAVCLRLSLYFF